MNHSRSAETKWEGKELWNTGPTLSAPSRQQRVEFLVQNGILNIWYYVIIQGGPLDRYRNGRKEWKRSGILKVKGDPL